MNDNDRNIWMKLAVNNDLRWIDCTDKRYELERRLGNAFVPQQAEFIARLIVHIEENEYVS
jgi:hypothetical protein